MKKRKYFLIGTIALLVSGYAFLQVEQVPVIEGNTDVILLPRQVSVDQETALNAEERIAKKKDMLVNRVAEFAPGVSEKINSKYSEYADKYSDKISGGADRLKPFVFSFYAPNHKDLEISINGSIVKQENREITQALLPPETMEVCLQSEKPANILIDAGSEVNKGIQLIAIGKAKRCFKIESSGNFIN
jgi:hypothetical protein